MFFWSQEKVKRTEIERWIEEKYASKTKEILKTSEEHIATIEESKHKMRIFLEELKFMEPDERVFKKVYKSAMTSQDKFVRSLLMAIKKIDTEYTDTTSLKKVHANLREATDSIQKYIGMHGRYLKIVYENEMKQFNAVLRTFAENIEKLRGLLEDPDFVKLEELKNLIDYNISRKEEIEKNKSFIKEIKEDIGDIKEEIEHETKKLSANEGTIKKEKKKMHRDEELKKRFKRIENAIYGKIAPLKREMRKVERFIGDRKLKDQIRRYRDSPVKTFLNDPDLAVFKEILSNIEEIEKNAHKREKTLNLLNYILEGNLKNKKKEYTEYREKIDSFVVPHKGRDKKRKIKRKTDTLHSKIDSKRKKIEEIKEKNDQLQKEIVQSKEKMVTIMEEDFDIRVEE